MRDLCRNHKFLSTYLDYVEDTESPRMFHVWTALSCISAALGRRVWYSNGIENIYPNQYIIMTGPSGVKKSTAIKIGRNLLKQSTGVKFAPDDTAGQRQGLIMAMMRDDSIMGEDGDEFTKDIARVMAGGDVGKIGDLQLDLRDPRSLYVAATEFNSFIGEKSTSLATFLLKLWDGDDYSYMLKKETINIKDGLIGILGGTTPSQIAISMPAEAIGQGLTSRMVFVFGNQKYKSVPRPKPLNGILGNKLCEYFAHAFNNLNGQMKETDDAARKMDWFYDHPIDLRDPRFVAYAERRHTHLQKLVTTIAASDQRMQIEVQDIELADALLRLAEAGMPDALGEYGLSKLSGAKQRLVELIRSSTDPIAVEAIYGLMSRDMTQVECRNALNDLISGGSVNQVNLPGKEGLFIIAKMQNVRRTKDEALKLM